MYESIIIEVRKVYKKKVLFTTHALNQMNLQERMISRHEVYEVIENGELIEDYPDDPRGHSCLIGKKTSEGRWVHVVCAPKEEYLAIVTAYLPGKEEWTEDMKTRSRK
jgi:hypothetical protein